LNILDLISCPLKKLIEKPNLAKRGQEEILETQLNYCYLKNSIYGMGDKPVRKNWYVFIIIVFFVRKIERELSDLKSN